MGYDAQSMYTIKEASGRSGVGIPLLRAWERRYRVVAPTRTPSGYRLYDEAAISRLRAMRHLIATGWSAQQAAEHVRATPDAEITSLAPPADRASGPSPGAGGADAVDGSRITTLIERLVDAACALDTSTLEATLDDAFSSARFEVVADRVVMPALRAIGEAWERGEISIAGEHAASHLVLRRLGIAYEAAGDTAATRPILVGLGPDARHELGALAFAIAARRAGLPVLYLGPDLPAADWLTAAVERDARGAVIGVPTGADVRGATEVLTVLRAGRKEMLLAVGGDGAADTPHAVDVLELSATLPEAVAEVWAALGGPRRG